MNTHSEEGEKKKMCNVTDQRTMGKKTPLYCVKPGSGKGGGLRPQTSLHKKKKTTSSFSPKKGGNEEVPPQ